MARLFLVVLGGRTAKSNIELHDVRFVAGDTIEATYPELKRQWFGARSGLHIDAYMAVEFVDGYAVSLSSEVPKNLDQQLWFVNMGAHNSESLAELHHFGVLVAPSAQAAKASAKRHWLPGAHLQHKDDLCSIDNCLAIQQLEIGSDGPWHVQLNLDPQGRNQAQVPDWFGYRLI